MGEKFDISLVVSSYNQENKVGQTIDSIYKNKLDIFTAVELIIIDDGSPIPVEPNIPPAENIPAKMSMRLIRQENSGIGATRNLGFREANSKLVLFLDDDIILEPDTIQKIYEGEREYPGAVIFGNYPFISHDSESLQRFARLLYGYDDITKEKKFKRVNAITSGLLCVNKIRLGNPYNFYRDDMTIPAAEEHEVISRFEKMGIPIYRAQHIVAMHNHHLELGWMAQQQFKYGMATAEAFIKNPAILEMKQFADMQASLETKGIKKGVKAILSSVVGRKLVYIYARMLERLFPRGDHNKVFGILTTIFYYAGYKKGRRKFSPAA